MTRMKKLMTGARYIFSALRPGSFADGTAVPALRARFEDFNSLTEDLHPYQH
jgi:hypothetical protein